MMTTDYINILNAGSGLNTKEIIDSLIVAERTPLENLISDKKRGIRGLNFKLWYSETKFFRS